MNDCSGREYHEATKHSWLSVRRHPNRLDWEHQPNAFKFYPDWLPRIALQKRYDAHRYIYHIGGITAKKRYPGVEYYLRTNPSAGALYPNELYFQARSVEGFDDGIYHFEVATSSAVKLCDIGSQEGLEPFLKLAYPMGGLLFFVSAVYYRSSWKYKKRAYRYCLLDAGHILGNIEAGAYLYRHGSYLAYDIDLDGMNAFFGFDQKEFFLSAAVAAVPMKELRGVEPPSISLPSVDPLEGYFEVESVIEKAYVDTRKLRECRKEPRHPKFSFDASRWEEAIMTRRSIREFSKKPITKGVFEALLGILEQPVPSNCDEMIEIYIVVNRVEGMPPGIYRGMQMLEQGIFDKKAAYLCLEQRLGSDSAVTFFMLSNGCNYRALYQKAGLLGERLYLLAAYFGIGCSGIGAYYDDEVNTFLKHEGMVLYAMAVGY